MDHHSPSEWVERARAWNEEGRRPVGIIRAMRQQFSATGPEFNANQFVQLFIDAFDIEPVHSYAIFGWKPDGSGELSDERLDDLLGRRIAERRLMSQIESSLQPQ